MHNEYITVPFSQLIRSPHNVRNRATTKEGKAARQLEIMAIAESIKAYTLLHNLVVHVVPDSDCIMAVADGWTRHEAISLLIERGEFPADPPIPCKVIPEEQAKASSLSANVHRVDLHPADQYLAFKKLHGEKCSIEDIAAQFSVSPVVVSRRLKLANVAPRFIKLFRNDEIGLDCMMALAITDDHKRQIEVWDSLPPHRRKAYTVREALTQDEIPSTERVARFVTVKAYEKAGGATRRDMFTDAADNSIYLADRKLLNELAQRKLDKLAEGLIAEGFAWSQGVFDYSDVQRQYSSLPMVRREPTESEAAQLVELNSAIETADAVLDSLEESEDEDADEKRDAATQHRQVLEDQQQEIEDALLEADPAYRDLLGAVVTIGHNGKTQYHRSLIRNSDKSKVKKQQTAAASQGLDGPTSSPVTDAGFSERLNRTLSGHVNAALQASLARNSSLALAALTHSLVMSVFRNPATYHEDRERSVLSVSLRSISQSDILTDDTAAVQSLNADCERWRQRLPERDLFAWVRGLPTDELLDLLAVCVAQSIDIVTGKAYLTDAGRELASVAALDMSHWWKATPDNFLTHVTKPVIAAVMTEVGHPEVANNVIKCKKGDAVVMAQAVINGTRWVPSVMRF